MSWWVAVLWFLAELVLFFGAPLAFVALTIPVKEWRARRAGKAPESAEVAG